MQHGQLRILAVISTTDCTRAPILSSVSKNEDFRPSNMTSIASTPYPMTSTAPTLLQPSWLAFVQSDSKWVGLAKISPFADTDGAYGAAHGAVDSLDDSDTNWYAAFGANSDNHHSYALTRWWEFNYSSSKAKVASLNMQVASPIAWR